jgi:hypothetical protein
MLSLNAKDTKSEKSSPLEKIITDRSKVLKSTVKALLDEISQREAVHNRLTDTIDCSITDHGSDLIHLKSLNTHYDFEKFVQTTKLITKLEDQILDLEKERRQELLEFWRDSMFLRKYLMSTLSNYWNLAGRKEALSNIS